MDYKSQVTDPTKATRVEVYWHTVKYRTVILYAVVITAIILSSVYLLFPSVSAAVLRHLSSVLEPPATNSAVAVRQTRFVNLDGNVRVKKVNSLQWTNADYQMTLDTGDQVQAGPDSVARIQFGDGTQYTVKSQSFVTVEENIVAQDRPTEVSMQVHSGQVDLATGPWEDPRSKAEVSFANAVASLKANSRAAVVSDPQTQQQQITVDAGSAELTRGNQHETIGQYERGSVSTTGQITKTQVLAPPQLTEPVDLTPIITADPKHYTIHFAWNQVATAKTYEFQASTTAVFDHLTMDRKTADTSVDVSGFDPSPRYFWRVLAIDSSGNVSDASDPYRFTLVAQGKGEEMPLTIDSQELQGNIAQISGRTEPGAALMVNGQAVAAIKPDGHFTYFTPPMARGSHEIVITGQDRRGWTNTKRIEVVVP